jgi:hypothetical protein
LIGSLFFFFKKQGACAHSHFFFLFMQRYETPQGTILPPLARQKSIDEKRYIEDGPVMDMQATKESLRAGSLKGPKLTPSADTQKKQEQKSKAAAEYSSTENAS